MSLRETRRKFLQHSSQTGAVLAAATALGGIHGIAAEKPATVRLGIIGCGGIMSHHLRELVRRREDVAFAWLCDVDPRQIDKAAGILADFQTASLKRTKHYEAILSDSDVDACIIATPHHWHAPIALAAMAAGKDVYVEKPISHVYAEGPRMIAGAKKYGRVVQQGSQMRSSPVTKKAGKLLKEGIIGDIKVARAWTAET